MALRVDIRKKLDDFLLESAFTCEAPVTGLLGASGCGKSMTLRCIAGVEKPDEGRIELDGRVLFDSAAGIDLKPQKRQVGLLFQNYALFPNMTVEGNLKMGLKTHEKDSRRAAEKIAGVVSSFGLTGLEKHYPNELSGGQQQRTALGRIFLSQPELLLLDEPFSALDEYLRWEMELELADLLEEFGKKTLFVSHNRDEIYRICDDVCVMDNGKTGDVVPVREMFASPGSKAASLLSGCKNYAKVEKAVPEEDGIKVTLPEWGVCLICHPKEGLPEDLSSIRWIGVRSHFVRPAGPDDVLNRIPCRIGHVIEDLFGMILILHPLDEAGSALPARIRADLSKEEWNRLETKPADGERFDVTAAPEDVMPLK